jgi:cytochrome c-type biogenesis protein CcmH/NrfG
MGKLPESTAIYEEILKTDPNNLDALYGLGLNLSLDPSKSKDAATLWQKFLEKAPATDSRVVMVKEGIQSLGIPEVQTPKADDRGRRRKP